MAFGGSFHSAVESLQQAQIEGAPLPPLESLLLDYDRAWKEQTAVTYAKTEDESTLRQLAEPMLNAYRVHVNQSSSGAGAKIIGMNTSTASGSWPTCRPSNCDSTCWN